MTIKFSCLLLVLISCQLSIDGQQTYRLDTSKSTLSWNSGEVGRHTGYIRFSSGNLLFSKDGKPASGTFVIDMRTIKSTDNKDASKNLKTDETITKPDFFDVSKYPEAKMVVTGIEKVPNSGYHRVKGDLTIKGFTNPIVFIAAIESKDNLVNIRADIDLRRGWWGIHSEQKPPSLDLLSGLPQKAENDQFSVSLKLVLTK
jgi:polyisoprenoid-binding protein YceI